MDPRLYDWLRAKSADVATGSTLPELDLSDRNRLPELDLATKDSSVGAHGFDDERPLVSGKLHDDSNEAAPGIDLATHSGDLPPPAPAAGPGSEWSLPDDLLLRALPSSDVGTDGDPDAEVSREARRYMLQRMRDANDPGLRMARSFATVLGGGKPEDTNSGLDRDVMGWLQSKDKTATQAQASEQRGAEYAARSQLQAQLALEREARIRAQFGNTLSRQTSNDEWQHTRAEGLDEEKKALDEAQRKLLEAKAKKLAGGGAGGGDQYDLDIPNANATVRLRPGPLLTKAVIRSTVDQAKAYNAALGGMDEIEKSLSAVIDKLSDPNTSMLDKPGEVARAASNIAGQSNDVASTLRVAMKDQNSRFGFEQVESQLGVHFTDPLAMTALIQGALNNPEDGKKNITNRVRAAKALTIKNIQSSMAPIADWRPKSLPGGDGGAGGLVPMVSVATKNTVMLSPESAKILKAAGKVRDP